MERAISIPQYWGESREIRFCAQIGATGRKNGVTVGGDRNVKTDSHPGTLPYSLVQYIAATERNCHIDGLRQGRGRRSKGRRPVLASHTETRWSVQVRDFATLLTACEGTHPDGVRPSESQ